MRGFNRVIIVGNLTRDPEVKVTQSGKQYARFSVAINSAWKDASGETKESAIYVPVVAWDKLADLVARYVHKGDGILIEGKLNIYSLQGQDGAKVYRTDVVANTVQFCGDSNNRQQAQSSYGGQRAPQAQAQAPQAQAQAPQANTQPRSYRAAQQQGGVTSDELWRKPTQQDMAQIQYPQDEENIPF